MPDDLPKAYDPAAIEEKWAEYWVSEKLFTQPAPSTEPDDKRAEGKGLDGQSFVILLPPPNVTGRLHMGHMLNQTEMDILTRWHRTKGDRTLWVPGTDHAGIATQMMVERQVAAEGTSRQTLGREAFLERVWTWRKQYGGAILDQMKRLGASVDWSREYFTMDANLSVAVREAFVRLYGQGLIYRGAYVVNWCPGCQTAVSDLEVIHEEVVGKLWEIRYAVAGSPGEFLTIATTRPETLLGDVAVAIHPEDERYTHLHGKKLILPLMGREIPIVLDEWVSRDFGTGAVKITPAHDANDFAMGQRHHLPSINIMDDTAHINSEGGIYTGLDRYEARTRILVDLDALGLLGTIHDHKLSVGRCDRSKDVIEPRLSTQWFVKIEPLAQRAVEVVEQGHIRFTPEQYKKTYLNWMANIHDWCISRQLWWGHRIPAWHCEACHRITVPASGAADPENCEHCGSEKIVQEIDVLDTWFSSGLLPLSVFGWPFADDKLNKPSADFNTFYPTSLLVTGFDILFFWVARMIMLGCWFAADVPNADGSVRELKDTVPFRDVYIHALVRDANREKMAKTKGNVIDPIGVVEKYGTDAVRFTLAAMASPGTDIAFNEARTEGYRAFANKIWNAARFIFMNVDRAREIEIEVNSGEITRSLDALDHWPIEERWILARLDRTGCAVESALERYRFDEAASALYQFFWGEFCDWYLEIVKLRLVFDNPESRDETAASMSTLFYVFEASLRLLSPFMPFITEEIWQAMRGGTPSARSIAITQFPKPLKSSTLQAAYFEAAETSMELLQEAIVAIRSRRKDLGVEEKIPAAVTVASLDPTVFPRNLSMLQKLARVSSLDSVHFEDRDPGGRLAHLQWQSFGKVDIVVHYEKEVDVPAERERLTKEIGRLEKNVVSAERQLENEAFLAKAPANIVEGLKNQKAENAALLVKAKAALDALPPSA